MGVEAKHAYRETFLESEDWKDIRYAKLVRDGCSCDICGKEDFSNDVHHVHYPKRWKETTSGDLVVLCRAHHTMIHMFKQLCCKNLSTSWENYIAARAEIRSQATFEECEPAKKPIWFKEAENRYSALRARLFRIAQTRTTGMGIKLPAWLRRFLEGKNPPPPLAVYIQQIVDKKKVT